MNTHFDMSYLNIVVDMAGCPNRCRHCWLGSHRNGNISVDEFRDITTQFKNWQLARDESYARWAATLPPKVCQISFFGMEENTDWGMRRKGAFRDQLLTTERCLEVGIVPRWQLFAPKRCLHETEDFLRLAVWQPRRYTAL